MSAILKILILLLFLIVGGGAVFLLNWDMPSPSEKVEKVIPNERILR